MGTRPRPRQAAAAAAGGDGAREARTGPRQSQTCCDTPATARLRRGRPLTTLQPTKRQPATAGAVEWGGRVATARQTTTRAAPGCSPFPHTHAGAALRRLTMHISTNDLHCCKPARLLQLAPSGGRPHRRPLATAPPRITPSHQQRPTTLEDAMQELFKHLRLQLSS
jgi:hypothetical protein